MNGGLAALREPQGGGPAPATGHTEEYPLLADSASRAAYDALVLRLAETGSRRPTYPTVRPRCRGDDLGRAASRPRPASRRRCTSVERNVRPRTVLTELRALRVAGGQEMEPPVGRLGLADKPAAGPSGAALR